jgi:glycosyltransferase involved in cell wall biosynthesis
LFSSAYSDNWEHLISAPNAHSNGELRCVVASHFLFEGAAHATVRYLSGRCERVLLVLLPFDYASDPIPRVQEWERGHLVRDEAFGSRVKSGLLQYFKDFLLILRAVGTANESFNVAIAHDSLIANAFLVLRQLNKVDRVIFHTIDYVPKRFQNRFLNSAYHLSDQIAAAKSDIVWNLTARVNTARVERHRRLRMGSASSPVVVPIGADYRGARPGAEDSKTVVFVGSLLEKQGLQLVFEAWSAVLASVPDAHMLVIGTGPFEATLRQIVKDKGIDSSISWTGEVSDHNRVLDLLSMCALGLAPYSADLDTWTYYADPTKVRDYLACDLPVIITDVPLVAREIQARHAGCLTEYSAPAIADAIVKLLSNPSSLKRARAAAAQMGQENTWDRVLSRAFRESLPKLRRAAMVTEPQGRFPKSARTN